MGRIGFIQPCDQPPAASRLDPHENLQHFEVWPQTTINLTPAERLELLDFGLKGVFPELIHSTLFSMEDGDGLEFKRVIRPVTNEKLEETLSFLRGGTLILERLVWWKTSEAPVFDFDSFFAALRRFALHGANLLAVAARDRHLGILVNIENLAGNRLMFNPPSHSVQLPTVCRSPAPIAREEALLVESRSDLLDSLTGALLRMANEVLNTFRVIPGDEDFYPRDAFSSISGEDTTQLLVEEIAKSDFRAGPLSEHWPRTLASLRR